MLRTATISIFLSDAKCGPGVSIEWAKNFEKISNFSPFRDFSPYIIIIIINLFANLFILSQKLLKIEAYKQRMEKKLYLSPIQLSHVFGPIGHVVLQGWPKMSDAIPVFSISPIVLHIDLD